MTYETVPQSIYDAIRSGIAGIDGVVTSGIYNAIAHDLRSVNVIGFGCVDIPSIGNTKSRG